MRLVLITVLILATPACGGTPGQERLGGSAGAAGSAGAPVFDATSPGYPPGPYGASVGATVPDLALEGYVSDGTEALAYAAPLEALSLGVLRDRAVHDHALLHVSGFT